MPSQIDRCFVKPVIPVFWDGSAHKDLLASASSVIIQGGSAAKLAEVVEKLREPPLDHLRLFVHLDLVAGMENNDAGLELLTQLGDFDGIVTVHQHLLRPAKQLGLLSILRVFLTDSRALERGLKIAKKAKPDVVEILPAAAAAQVAEDFQKAKLDFISGGLCRIASDVQQALAGGSHAVTSTDPELWKLNE